MKHYRQIIIDLAVDDNLDEKELYYLKSKIEECIAENTNTSITMEQVKIN